MKAVVSIIALATVLMITFHRWRWLGNTIKKNRRRKLRRRRLLGSSLVADFADSLDSSMTDEEMEQAMKRLEAMRLLESEYGTSVSMPTQSSSPVSQAGLLNSAWASTAKEPAVLPAATTPRTDLPLELASSLPTNLNGGWGLQPATTLLTAVFGSNSPPAGQTPAPLQPMQSNTGSGGGTIDTIRAAQSGHFRAGQSVQRLEAQSSNPAPQATNAAWASTAEEHVMPLAATQRRPESPLDLASSLPSNLNRGWGVQPPTPPAKVLEIKPTSFMKTPAPLQPVQRRSSGGGTDASSAMHAANADPWWDSSEASIRYQILARLGAQNRDVSQHVQTLERKPQKDALASLPSSDQTPSNSEKRSSQNDCSAMGFTGRSELADCIARLDVIARLDEEEKARIKTVERLIHEEKARLDVIAKLEVEEKARLNVIRSLEERLKELLDASQTG